MLGRNLPTLRLKEAIVYFFNETGFCHVTHFNSVDNLIIDEPKSYIILLVIYSL